MNTFMNLQIESENKNKALQMLKATLLHNRINTRGAREQWSSVMLSHMSNEIAHKRAKGSYVKSNVFYAIIARN